MAAAACSSRGAAPPARSELVGDPLGAWRAAPAEAYARNLWDLQAFRGRLYLGYGDAVTNTGPTDVIAFDPDRRVFEREITVQEEAILLYRVLGDRLFMPGTDAVDSDDGMLYVRDAAGWTHLALPQAAHVLDVAVRGTDVCVVVQDRRVGGEVRCTADGGHTWRSDPTASWRAVSLFELGGTLYVSSHKSGVRRVGGDKIAFAIPGVPDDGDVLVRRPVRCGDAVAFLAARVDYTPDFPRVDILGLFRASLSSDTAAASRDTAAPATAGSGRPAAIAISRINVPGEPADIFAHDGHCYAVTNQPRDSGFDVAIVDLDGATARPRARFSAEAMARSGELLGGYFYIGLGCEPGHCTAAAGRLLRIPIAP